MKLTTIVRAGQDRAAVVLDLPEGWDGSGHIAEPAPAGSAPDPNAPPSGYARYFLDVAVARRVLATTGARVRWPAAMVGLPYEHHVTVRRILAGGPPALAALRDLVETMRRLALSGDDDALLQQALVPASCARLRTPVPDSPLWMVLHGNSPTVWRKQEEMDPTQHIMTRVPAKRVRPVTSLLGQDEPLYLPPQAELSFGAELGFVIGAPAHRVSAEHAYRHVAGYLCTNDGYCNVYTPHVPGGRAGDVRNTTQIADKAADGCGPAGPWIVTHEEVGDPHDLMLWTRQDGRLRNRSHTGSHLMGVEDAVERLSHLFTLQPGTIVSLGAAGWDGIGDIPANHDSGRTVIEVEAERVGALRTPVFYPDAPQQAERIGKSPYYFVGTVDGSSPLDRLRADRAAADDAGPPALPGLPPPHGFWMLLGNQRDAASLELEGCASPALPAPVAVPVASLGVAAAADSGQERLVVIPADAGAVRVTCQLAVVIGPEHAYAETPETAVGRVAGLATLLAIHDAGPTERLVPPVTDYERRFSSFLGYCGDGRHILGQATPVGSEADIAAVRAARLRVNGVTHRASTADYTHDAAATIVYLSRAITLLPGDVIGLGPLGPALEVPAEGLVRGVVVEAELEGLAPDRVLVRRD